MSSPFEPAEGGGPTPLGKLPYERRRRDDTKQPAEVLGALAHHGYTDRRVVERDPESFSSTCKALLGLAALREIVDVDDYRTH